MSAQVRQAVWAARHGRGGGGGGEGMSEEGARGKYNGDAGGRQGLSGG